MEEYQTMVRSLGLPVKMSTMELILTLSEKAKVICCKEMEESMRVCSRTIGKMDSA
jgi:hypothetical protein